MDLRRALPVVLIVVAVGLIVTHFVLDSGDGDSPGWILLLATFSAVGATFLASSNRRRR